MNVLCTATQQNNELHIVVAPAMWTGLVQFQMSSLGTQRAHRHICFSVRGAIICHNLGYSLSIEPLLGTEATDKKTANPTIYIGRATQARAVQAVKQCGAIWRVHGSWFMKMLHIIPHRTHIRSKQYLMGMHYDCECSKWQIHIRCGAAICFCRDVENECCIRWNGMAFYTVHVMYEYGRCLFDLTSIRIRLHDDVLPQPHNDTDVRQTTNNKKQTTREKHPIQAGTWNETP